MRPCDIGRKRNGNPSREVTPAARKRKSRWAKLNADPVKQRARRAVRTAMECGALVAAENCLKCGIYVYRSDGRRGIQAHHFNGYENPLDVQWLCPKCHRQADAAMAAQQRTPLENPTGGQP